MVTYSSESLCVASGERVRGRRYQPRFWACVADLALCSVFWLVGEPGEREEKKSQRQELSGSGPPQTWSWRVRFFTSVACFKFVF